MRKKKELEATKYSKVRKEKIRQGVCIHCEQLVDADSIFCTDCKIKTKEDTRIKRFNALQNNKCICGNVLDGDTKNCRECLSRASIYGKIRRDDLRMNKLCKFCGNILDGTSTTRCLKCSEKLNTVEREQKRQLKRDRKCITCRTALNESEKTRCTKCVNRRNELWNFKYQNDLDFHCRVMIRDCIGRDKQRGRTADLDLQQIKTSIKKGCIYCKERTIGQMGLDRIDNQLGYVISNVVPCCTTCNMIRRDMPYKAWLILAKNMPKVKKSEYLEGWTGFRRKATRVHKSLIASLD